ATVSTGLTDPMAMVSIASALRGIPLDDYTFIQYPVVEYAPDPNKLAPVAESWALIAEALENNQPIDVGDDEVEETETPEPTDTPSPTETPDSEQVVLPDYLQGSNADDSAGCTPAEGLF